MMRNIAIELYIQKADKVLNKYNGRESSFFVPYVLGRANSGMKICECKARYTSHFYDRIISIKSCVLNSKPMTNYCFWKMIWKVNSVDNIFTYQTISLVF